MAMPSESKLVSVVSPIPPTLQNEELPTTTPPNLASEHGDCFRDKETFDVRVGILFDALNILTL